MKAYTDYPITELGDIHGQKAPVRECTVLWYDGDKYCSIMIGGGIVEDWVKICYVYNQFGRCGEVPSIRNIPSLFSEIKKLEKKYEKWWKEECP